MFEDIWDTAAADQIEPTLRGQDLIQELAKVLRALGITTGQSRTLHPIKEAITPPSIKQQTDVIHAS